MLPGLFLQKFFLHGLAWSYTRERARPYVKIAKSATLNLWPSAQVALDNDPTLSREQICCLELKGLGDSGVSFEDSMQYITESRSYWSAGNIVEPACVYAPESAEQVSRAVQIFARNECQFAVRGGGHATVPGTNGRDGAVLLVTSRLRTLEVVAGRDVARIGPGNTWTDVYRATDAIGMVVPGGRMGTVGVAGVVLGGGISHQAAEYGFSCDNVVNYQVVTADGLIRNANATSDPDLFWALKGAGNRFGIVTAFDMKMYPLAKVYGGTISYRFTSLEEVLAQIDEFHRKESDPKASMIFSILDGRDVGYGLFLELVLYYGMPVTSPPEVFQPFFEIPGIFKNTVSLKSFSTFIPGQREGLLPGLFSHSWRSVTFSRDAGVNRRIADIFLEEVEEFRAKQGADIQLGLFTMSYELYHTGQITASETTGGNALGMERYRDNGPLMLGLLVHSWVNKTEADLRIETLKKSGDRMMEAAKEAGKHVDFVYVNAAGADQEPYLSYGAENVGRLRRIRDRYDPDGVFSRLQAGVFHL
ncbi:hypothetical protein TWF696_009714 [Orbilia brochopaga]|uniref:FAD-binding PCMH-type domain-containing protein n=1 Tax=Orbilia brochopaga TaxID=3140254 RepID=A0AAV9UFM4_9PEZI